MYGRQYGEHTLNFEASGGLNHASLVMRDKETDSWWSIMSGDALAGDLKGTRLEEVPIGVKTQFKKWVAEHPNTLVLSVDGKEHPERDPYADYFTSEKGFRGAEASDDRLPTKAPIFAFHHEGKAFAVPYAAFEGGATFDLGEAQAFFYRPADVAIFHSSVAFVGKGFAREGDGWQTASGQAFDPEEGTFAGGEEQRLDGFDTFWFNWSMNNPETSVLGGGE